MAFKREPLSSLLDKAYENYMSLLKPMERTPRYNLIRVLASIQAGTQHQNLGDLDFLVEQLFADTATGEYLRGHWSDRVPALYASTAAGTVRQTGLPGSSVPAGLVYQSANGKTYYTTKSYTVGSDGTVEVYVMAREAGAASNAEAGVKLTIISALTTGLDSHATVAEQGITGGVDEESDWEYRMRCIEWERTVIRYGKPGDFISWALDATPEVTKAFEIKNFGIFGALLVLVIGGNQSDAFRPVSQTGLDAVNAYIGERAPKVIYTVRSAQPVKIEPEIKLLPSEDTAENRELALSRLRSLILSKAAPAVNFTQEQIQSAIADGTVISSARVSVPAETSALTVLQYPVLGEVKWL